MTTPPNDRQAALAGVAAGAAALGGAELLAGLLPGAASPVVAIGDLVISLQPPGAKQFVVDLFGEADKLVLNLLIAAVAVARRGDDRRARAPVADRRADRLRGGRRAGPGGRAPRPAGRCGDDLDRGRRRGRHRHLGPALALPPHGGARAARRRDAGVGTATIPRDLPRGDRRRRGQRARRTCAAGSRATRRRTGRRDPGPGVDGAATARRGSRWRSTGSAPS